VTRRCAITSTRVRFGETDAAGIVFYPTFFAWFDLGMQSLARDGDTPAHTAGGQNVYPLPIVEAGATFLRPLMFDEPIEIVSTVAHVGASSIRLEHEIRRGDTVIATGFEVRVFVANKDTGIEKAPLPDDLRARLSEARTTHHAS